MEVPSQVGGRALKRCFTTTAAAMGWDGHLMGSCLPQPRQLAAANAGFDARGLPIGLTTERLLKELR